MAEYGMVKELSTNYDQSCEKLPEELQKEGFGVLTRIDMAAKIKEKLGVDREPYMIFGACNPPLANEAITAEVNLGLLLPCNAVIYVKDGKTFLGVVKPSVAMAMVENDNLASVAGRVEEKLTRVFDAMN